MFKWPKISIVIPVYNGSDFLSEAIESALQQDYENFEVIVINDGSCDNGLTEQTALKYQDKIRYYEKKNGGVASALNYALQVMKGDFISWLSHDDIYLQDKLSSQMALWKKMGCPNNYVYFGNAATFTDNKNACSPIESPVNCGNFFRYYLASSTTLHGCTLLIPKTAFVKAGNFQEDLRTTQDYDMWFRISEHYKFCSVDKILVKARQHKNQGSIQLKNTVLIECNQLIINFIDNFSKEDICNTEMSHSQAYNTLAIQLYRRGLHKAARHAITKARDASNNTLQKTKSICIKIYGESTTVARKILKK